MKPFIAVSVAVILICAAAPVRALEPGTYRCRQFNVSGGGGSCRLAPAIEIRADGTYKESRTEGTYRMRGDLVVFSGSKIRGPGKVTGGNRIRFEYDYNGFHHDVTYECRDCRTAAVTGTAQRTQRGSAAVDLTVHLRFDPSEGDMGWAVTAHLVPLEAARGFLSSGAYSPPAGSATGLAWTEGKHVVATRFRMAPAGQRCVVILDAGRERIPVAGITVASAPDVQELTLDASMKSGIPADAAAPGGGGESGR